MANSPAVPTTPLVRRTVVDLALDALRDRILHGHYPEGTALRQDALAADLGVSRIPVREALRRLEVEGLVSFNPHQGAIVSTLSLSEIDELFDLRAVIESELLRHAIPLLTDEVVLRATATLDLYDQALSRGDIAEWGKLNWAFHSTLLAAANRPLTLGVVQTLHNQSDRYMRLQLTLTHGEVRASGEHRRILMAAKRKQTDRACEYLAAHIRDAGASLIDFLRIHREGTAKT
jgi:DNA-binding GntR family transcriptional regulator